MHFDKAHLATAHLTQSTFGPKLIWLNRIWLELIWQTLLVKEHLTLNPIFLIFTTSSWTSCFYFGIQHFTYILWKQGWSSRFPYRPLRPINYFSSLCFILLTLCKKPVSVNCLTDDCFVIRCGAGSQSFFIIKKFFWTFSYLIGMSKKCIPRIGINIKAALAAFKVEAALFGPPATWLQKKCFERGEKFT